MILCFALGIANLFTINVLIIILSAICLYAPLSLPDPLPSLTPFPPLPLTTNQNPKRVPASPPS